MSVGLSGMVEADGDGKAGAEPWRPIGKFSFIGDRQDGSKFPLTGE